jgi:hypothetical protein
VSFENKGSQCACIICSVHIAVYQCLTQGLINCYYQQGAIWQGPNKDSDLRKSLNNPQCLCLRSLQQPKENVGYSISIDMAAHRRSTFSPKDAYNDVCALYKHPCPIFYCNRNASSEYYVDKTMNIIKIQAVI